MGYTTGGLSISDNATLKIHTLGACNGHIYKFQACAIKKNGKSHICRAGSVMLVCVQKHRKQDN